MAVQAGKCSQAARRTICLASPSLTPILELQLEVGALFSAPPRVAKAGQEFIAALTPPTLRIEAAVDIDTESGHRTAPAQATGEPEHGTAESRYHRKMMNMNMMNGMNIMTIRNSLQKVSLINKGENYYANDIKN